MTNAKPNDNALWVLLLALVLSNLIWLVSYHRLYVQTQTLLDWNRQVETRMECRYIGADWDCQQRGGR